MTQLYAIRNDGLSFKELDLTTMDVLNTAPETIPMADIIAFYSSNTAMANWWVTPETDFINNTGVPAGPIPDIALWSGGSGSALVLAPKSFRYLGDLLQPYGEFLPVKVGEEIYHIFNCLVLGESDDSKMVMEYVDGEEFGLKNIGFKESVNEMIVFKSTIDACITLFCGDRFKEAVESFELTGVVFDTNLVEVFD